MDEQREPTYGELMDENINLQHEMLVMLATLYWPSFADKLVKLIERGAIQEAEVKAIRKEFDMLEKLTRIGQRTAATAHASGNE